MDESDNALGIGEDAGGTGESDGNNGEIDNGDGEGDELLLESEENVHNIENNLNHDDTASVDVANNIGDVNELSPVTANNLSGGLESASSSPPKRYLQVEGFDGRRNDIVYCSPPASNATSNNDSNSSLESDVDAHSSGMEEKRPKLMLFFGGDIQV